VVKRKLVDNQDGLFEVERPESTPKKRARKPADLPSPTPEQGDILNAFTTNEHLVIAAGAGSGKTTTLNLLAGTTGRKGLYVAFGRAIKDEAKKKFPDTVECMTAHGLAYRAVGKDYRHRMWPKRPPMYASQRAAILGINEPVELAVDVPWLSIDDLARLTAATIKNFCHSADPEIDERHVPKVPGFDKPAAHKVLADHLAPYTRRSWEDLKNPNGQLKFEQDHYLKMWQLTKPVLPYEYILFDEAQDADPPIADVIGRQHVQKIYVGDQNQAIFGWRGAIDAMSNFNGIRLHLTQSFRFGHAIAHEANKWLTLLDADLRISGHPPIDSWIGGIGRPAAILCRTNAGTVAELGRALDAGQRPALVGGTEFVNELRGMARAALDLQEGRRTTHPELFTFTDWDAVRVYVQTEDDAADLRPWVALIDRHSPAHLLHLLDLVVSEKDADVVISTAHKAKGREWDTVRIAADFPTPNVTEEQPYPEIPRETAMLAYVSVTRARYGLDREGLAWVDDWLN
jgi:superfamily I DNA/RNA helicase